MQERQKRPTIKLVASAAGVSTQTVSRVINDRPDVSPETRERVLKVIEEMGYQPSALARSLIQQRSYTLGVVTAGLEIYRPIANLERDHHCRRRIRLFPPAQGIAQLSTAIIWSPFFQEFLSRHVDGIIWAVQEVGENRNWLKNPPVDLEIPIVFLTMQPREQIPIVSIDNYQGGRIVMAHLFEQGYRHIGHISGPLDWWEARQRMAAWKDALTEKGIKIQDSHWVEGNWSSASGAVAIEKLIPAIPGNGCGFCGQ